MLNQDLINAIIGIVGAGAGWWMKTMWESLRELQRADTSLVEKIDAIEVLVAGQYVRRDEVEKLFSAVFVKLDRIEEKLSGKADK